MSSPEKKKILLIEDDFTLSSILVDKFTQEGFEVLSSSNGEGGLAIAFKEHPDIILLDIILPDLNGISVIKEIRDDKWGEKVPIFVLSNLSEKEKVFEGSQKNLIDDYLIKAELKIQELVKKVREKLKD